MNFVVFIVESMFFFFFVLFVVYLSSYFINLIQQSGDLELLNVLHGMKNPHMYNTQNSFNITVLIPQQISVQQLGNSQELSLVNN
jgi:hypothetical protein